jgi:peroxiredoxin
MSTMQKSQTFKEKKNAALIPFGVLFTLLVIVYATTRSEINSRPELMQAGQETSAPKTAKESQPPAAGPMEGKQVPDFDLPTMDGKHIKLADLKGKMLFINIWATWCAPCREEMPSMEALYRQLKGPNFEMIAISVDKDREKSVAPFAKELGLTFPILYDPTSATANKFKITGVPETYLVAGNGLIIHHLVGPTKWDKPEIISALKQMVELNGKKSEKKETGYPKNK